jgi:signal transduction histidine kinase
MRRVSLLDTMTAMTDRQRQSLSVEALIRLIVVGSFAAAMVASTPLVIFAPGLIGTWLAGRSSPPAFGPTLVLTALAVALVQGAALLVALILVQKRVICEMKREIESRAGSLDPQRSALTAQMREAAAQEERHRLARDLHDTIKQQLFSINVAAATAQSLQARDPAGAAQHIQRVRDLSQAAMAEMKALLTQLRPQPLANIGLIGAIQEQLDALHFRAEVETALRHDPLPDEGQLPPGAQEAIFRTVQEALSNVARHARARRVSVRLSHETSNGRAWLKVSIEDDGQGFDPATTQPGMGLNNMRARIAELGGTLEMASAPLAGTTMQFSVPLIQPAERLAQARRAKEERHQRVYWATTLFGFALAALLGLILFGFLSLIVQERAELWGGWLWVGALAALVIAPLILGSLNVRRQVRNNQPRDSVWMDLLHYYDTGQVAFLLLVIAWAPFSLRAFVPAGVALIGVLLVIATNLRLYRRLNRRLADWATPQILRSRLKEPVVFLGFAVIFQIAVFAGAFGPMSDVKLFHDTIDRAWFTSFLALCYPLVILAGIPNLALTYLQYRRLVAMAPDDDMTAQTPATAGPRLRRLRVLAGGLTAIYISLAASVGVLLWERAPVAAALTGALALIVLGIKWRVERLLTLRVGEWSTLPAQQSALWSYTVFLIINAIGIFGGVFGFLLGAAAPNVIAGAAAPEPTAVWALFGFVTSFLAAPLYLSLQWIVTRRRVRALSSGAPGDRTRSTQTRRAE